MKFIFLALFLFSPLAQADFVDCISSCSPECVRQAGAIFKVCGSGTAKRDPEAVNACVNRFGAGDRGKECSGTAISGDAVNKCVDRFGAGDSGFSCAKSAISGDGVAACVNKFGAGDSGLQCSKIASSGQLVDNCVDKFGAGDSGLACIGVKK